MQATLGALIARTVGADKAQVQVHADLNVDQSTQEKLDYAKKGTPLQDDKETESLKGTGGAARRHRRRGGQPADLRADRRGRFGGNSDYKRTTGTTDYGVAKTVTHTKIAPGAINKLDVALLVDKSVPAAQATQLKNAVAAAAGINPKRGDTMTQSTVVFAKPKAVPGPAGLPVPPALLGPLKYVGIGLASLLFLFFMTRALRRREKRGPADADVAERDRGPAPAGRARAHHERGADPRRGRRGSSVPADARASTASSQEQPERVAQQLRAWISEDPE